VKINKATFSYFRALMAIKSRIEGCRLEAVFRENTFGIPGRQFCGVCARLRNRVCDLGKHPTPREQRLIDDIEKSEIV
jgi:hypothetical protein